MAGEGDAERLVVLLEARIRDFERNMQKASGTATNSYRRMRGDSRSATQQMEQDMVRSTNRINQALAQSASKMGAYGKAAIGGFVGGLVAGGVAEAVSAVRDIAKGVASIGDEAKRAGVSMKAFQEWKFVAEQNRIGVDALTDGLKELNLRADEFVITGKGSAAEAFQRLGYSAEDLKKKLEDPSELLLEIIGRLGKMEKAAQIRIADELFGGTAGERFVELLGQGEDGIRATIDRAHELGAVMDDELIKKAAELDKRFNEVATTVGYALKSAIVSAADSLADFIDSFRAYENQRNSSLADRSLEIDKRRLEIENRILEIKNQQGLRDAQRAKAIGSLQIELNKLNAESAQIEGILTQRREAAPRVSDRNWTPPTPPPGGFGSTGSGPSASERAAERAAQQAQRDIDRAVASQTSVAVDAAMKYLGQNERTNRGEINAFLRAGGVDLDAATTKWCAAFVNSALAQVGVKGSGSNIATDFANWGGKVDPSQIQRGDVLVDMNGRGAGQTGGHVGFATGLTRFSNGILQLQMLSGNASDSVQEDWVNASEVIARRADEAFKVPLGSLDHLGKKIEGVGDASLAVNTQLSELQDIGLDAVDGIAQAFSDGKITAEEWTSILTRLIGQLLQMQGLGPALGQLFGGGGFGGFSNSMFFRPTPGGFAQMLGLPGYASGTDFAPGGLARVNEEGGEIIDLPRGSRVIPHDVSMAMAKSSAPAQVNFTQNIHNNAGVEVRTEQSTDSKGNVRNDVYIDRMVARAMSQPGTATDKALASRGARRRPRKM